MSAAIRYREFVGVKGGWRRFISKATLVLLLVGIWSSWPTSVSAQSSIIFANRYGNLIDAPVVDTDGVTRVAGGAYLAQLYYTLAAFQGATPTSSAIKLGSPVTFGVGNDAGYFGADGQTLVALPALSKGQVIRLEVRVWEASGGATFEVAEKSKVKVGSSDLLLMPTVTPGVSQPLTGLRPIRLWSNGEVRSIAIFSPASGWYPAGSNLTLFASTRGVSALETYNWYHDGIKIPSLVNRTLLFSPLRWADAGVYEVRTGPSDAELISAPVRISVYEPLIIQRIEVVPSQPRVNEPFRVRVIASPSQEIRYLWSHNRKPIAGGTSDTLEVAEAMLGKYTVTVENDRESRTVTVATLRGIELDFGPGTEGGWIDVDPIPVYGLLNGATLTCTARAMKGFEFIGWAGDVAGTENPLVLIIDHPLSITAYFRAVSGTVRLANSVVDGRVVPVVDGSKIPLGRDWLGLFVAGPTTENLRPIGSPVSFQSGIIAQPQLALIDGVAPGGEAFVQLRFWKSTAAGSWEQAYSVPGGCGYSEVVQFTSGSSGFPPAPAPTVPGLTHFTVPDLPIMDRFPVGGAVGMGRPYRFVVAASSIEPVGYQWKLNGVDLPSATSPVLDIPAARIEDEGTYSVVVGNRLGTVGEFFATLRVVRPPTIRAVVLDETPRPRQPFRATVIADGQEPVTYLWLRNGQPILDGNFKSVLEMTDALPGTYRIEVSNVGGTDAQDIATVPPFYRLDLSVVGDGQATASPALELYEPGAVVMVQATPGFASLFAQWSGDAKGTNAQQSLVMDRDRRVVATFSTVGGTVLFANRVGANPDAPVFGADGITRLEGEAYRAQLYGGKDPLTLIPLGTPQSFRTGAGAGYIAGSTVRVPKVSPGEVAWLQMRAWEVAAGSTFEEVYAKGGSCGASPLFQLTTGGFGNPPSLPSVLSGLQSFRIDRPKPLQIIESPTAGETQVGESLRLSVGATGSGTITYQWLHNGVEMPGATNAFLDLTYVGTSDAGAYEVRVSDGLSFVISVPAKVGVRRRLQTLQFETPERVVFGNDPIPLVAQASSDLPAAIEVVTGPGRMDQGQLILLGAGSIQLRASQSGDASYLAAEPVERRIEVAKARAEILLREMEQIADGQPKTPTAITVPAGLAVDWRFDGRSIPPSEPGVYWVETWITDGNYEGLSVGPLRLIAPTFEFQGTIFEDTNGDGNRAELELGLEGFTVRTSGTAGEQVATTDSNGEFHIGNLPSGTYAVTVMPQPGYVATGSPEDPLTGSPGETLRWELGYRRRPATATEQYQ
ncbi:MAG: hypothetical protein JNK85_16235, partial [Verrucomicrobiales bacterium]|nr:hypothetical protein [Verrucomicrobiales bacterium]